MGEGRPGVRNCDREIGCLERRSLADGTTVSLLDGAVFDEETGTYGEPLYHGIVILIHAICLTDAELDRVAETGTMVVFSPSSEEALYCEGAVTPVARMLERGIPVALGPDWTVSGEDNMLAEMRYVVRYAEREGLAELLTPEQIWRMATYDGAYVVGLHEYVGSVEEGKLADIVIFGRHHPSDPYRAVIESSEPDVDLVLVGGQAYFGDAESDDLLSATTAEPYRERCETIPACDRTKFICASDPSAGGRYSEWTLAEIDDLVCEMLEGGTGEDCPEHYGECYPGSTPDDLAEIRRRLHCPGHYGRCHPGSGDGRDDRLPLIDPGSCP